MSGELETTARYALELAFGRAQPPAVASAPGRCTLVGEHVDYADGLVACIGIQLGLAVALRRSPVGRWRITSGAERAERAEAELENGSRDLADRVLAVVLALRAGGIAVPPLDVAVAADLPAGAGLSSSAALSVAMVVGLLRLVRRRLPAREVAHIALVAERDLLGIPVGPLDQRAVVLAPDGGALLLDCRDGGVLRLPWRLQGVRLVAVATGTTHDVGGGGYGERRGEADAALAILGGSSWREVTLEVAAAAELQPPLDGRARHLVTETERAAEAALAIREGDAQRLGELMSASHASLRDDYAVSTAALDATVAAAEAVGGCLGARLVGAGFGGTAVALVTEEATAAVLRAMRSAAGAAPGAGWVLEPAAGAAARAPDAVS